MLPCYLVMCSPMFGVKGKNFFEKCSFVLRPMSQGFRCEAKFLSRPVDFESTRRGLTLSPDLIDLKPSQRLFKKVLPFAPNMGYPLAK
jgi:hypothetical protein